MIARFNLAVDRRKKGDHPEADFIPCKAFEQRAEFVRNYLFKGMKIILEGRIQTGSFEGQDGKKIYTFDVVADNFEFCEKKQDGEQTQPQYQQPAQPQQYQRPQRWDAPPPRQQAPQYQPQAPAPQVDLSDFEDVISDPNELPF